MLILKRISNDGAGKVRKITTIEQNDNFLSMRGINKETSLGDAGLSARTRNLLYQNASIFGIKTRFGEKGWDFPIGALEGYPMSKLRRYRGFGVASMQEIIKMLQRAGVQLDLEDYREEPVQRNVIYFTGLAKRVGYFMNWPAYFKNKTRRLLSNK